jgi:hypothetical protein
MKNLFVASAMALLLGTAAAQADFLDNSYVSILGGPTFAPASMSMAPRTIWIPDLTSARAMAVT